MSREREDQERPCLHCMMVELIDDFFAEHPATAGSDKVDTDEADEVIDAIAKTVAELTSQQDGLIRQQVIEDLMHAIMNYDAEFRREEATSTVGSNAKHRPRFGSSGARGPIRPHPNLDAGRSAFGAAPIRRVSPRTSIFQNDAIAACSF
jgi:hypothetical protein